MGKKRTRERGRMKLKVVVLGCVFLSAFLMAGSASATALQGDIRYMDPYLISEYANAFFADPLNYDGPWIQEIMSPSSNAHSNGFPSDEVRVGMTLPSSMQFRNSDMAAEGPGVVNGETDLSQDAGLGAVEAPIGVGSEEDGALGVQPAGAEAGLDSKPEEDATEVPALEMGSSVTRRLAPVEEEEEEEDKNDDMSDDKEEEEEKKEEEEKEEKEEENEEMNTSGRRLLRRDDDDSVKAVYDEDALVKLLKAVGAGGRKLFGTSDQTEAQV